ncbi:GlcNAc-PI de-N-acetylase [Lentzea atacamensis]|uniref:GlcNAc-PI de-N-acetylase n=1 Tax=Lentzea atacamensis TaxID=531938 RepID=A0A316ID91_9PSEU|nr:PIG-L family deacetylase [Lentzea atacamensis]PWK90853.1 GlcNAc-PI de-N-acetylase [Lentzea atacamensis]
MTTVSFVAHPDDDLLFMNPDIAANVWDGHDVWVVYFTAGDIPHRPDKPGGIEYSEMRLNGARAAYARTAGVANEWAFEQMTFGGHPVATNKLVGANVRIVYTYIHAAAGPEDNFGDLWRLLNVPGFEAQPIDGRPPYTYDGFVGMIRGLIAKADPDLIRTSSSIGHREGDHVDHTAGAILVADANTDGAGRTAVLRCEYVGYKVLTFPENVHGFLREKKTEIWDEYWPHDPELNAFSWRAALSRRYQPDGRVFHPGVPWVPPGDFASSVA